MSVTTFHRALYLLYHEILIMYILLLIVQSSGLPFCFSEPISGGVGCVEGNTKVKEKPHKM